MLFLRVVTYVKKLLILMSKIACILYCKTCLKRALKKEDHLTLNAGQKYCKMRQGEHSAILLTFIKIPFVIKIFVLSFLSCCLRHILLY